MFLEYRQALAGLGRRGVVIVLVFAVPLPAIGLVSGLNSTVAVALFITVVATTVGFLRLFTREGFDAAGTVPAARVVMSGAVSVVIIALAIQAIPYGRSHDNPPVVSEPAWDSEVTRALTVKACFDCHSNEVEYPWYANVAPVSWAVQSHVTGGRHDLNYSEWNRPQEEAHESAETVEDGSMPPWYYELVRPGLLSDAEKQDLIRGLEATFGTEESESEAD